MPEIPGAVVAPGQVSEKIALHQLHDHPDILLLEGHPKKLDDVLVPAAPQDCDLFQEQLLLPLAHIALKDLDSNLMDFCQHTSVYLCTKALPLSQIGVQSALRTAPSCLSLKIHHLGCVLHYLTMMLHSVGLRLPAALKHLNLRGKWILVSACFSLASCPSRNF